MQHKEKPTTNRRVNKPIMEKRRRARINTSLDALKTLVLEGMKKDPERHSKLEKADILEMAVTHLRSLHTGPVAERVRYREGYTECAREVAAYLSRLDTLDKEAKRRLMMHLASSLGRDTAGTTAGIHLMAAQLPTGELAFILPSVAPADLQQRQRQGSGHLPLSVSTAETSRPAYSVSTPSPGSSSSSSSSGWEPADLSSHSDQEPTDLRSRPDWGPADLRARSNWESTDVSSHSYNEPAGLRSRPDWRPADLSSHPADLRSCCSPSLSVTSASSPVARPDSPQPLDLVSHNRARSDDRCWRPW